MVAVKQKTLLKLAIGFSVAWTLIPNSYGQTSDSKTQRIETRECSSEGAEALITWQDGAIKQAIISAAGSSWYKTANFDFTASDAGRLSAEARYIDETGATLTADFRFENDRLSYGGAVTMDLSGDEFISADFASAILALAYAKNGADAVLRCD